MGKRVMAPPRRETEEEPESCESKLKQCKNKFNNLKNDGSAVGKHGQMPFLSTDQYADVQLPELQQWDAKDIKLDSTIIAIGKRRTGKSWCLRNIMFEMKDKIGAGIVISQTDELNKFWRQYCPKCYIYPKYDPEILDMVFKRQKAILNNTSKTKAEIEKEAPFFILLDDVISDQRLKFDENLIELFVAGRHYKLFVLITTQYAKGLNPTLRGNTDYVICCKTLQGRQRESLWEDFGDFMTKDGFFTLLDEYTEDNEVIVFDTSENTSDPLAMLKWWKAEDPGKFRMGSKEYWDSAKRDLSLPPADSEQNPLAQLNQDVKMMFPKKAQEYIRPGFHV
jgi:hypothetical protein